MSNRKETRVMPNRLKIAVGDYDFTIFITVILLILVGIVMVFSSSYYVASTSAKYHYDMYYLVRRQAMAAALGVGAMIVMANFDYKRLKKFAFPLYVVSIGLLIYTSLFGISVGGARRWIELPLLGRFQPSELAKVGIILFISNFIAERPKLLKSLIRTVVPALFVGIVCVIIAIGTRNASSAIIIAVIGFGIIFIASPHTAIFVILGSGAAGLMALMLSVSTSFRGNRWDAWLDPFSDPRGIGFQPIQSLYAIASGGMFGLGLGQSRQKLGFIPEAHNDIIFSIIAEELGLVGSVLVLFLFAVLVWRAVKVAINAPDLFGSLVAAGIALMIGSQVVINVAVVTNTIPNTGVPLPFISYGGTSLSILIFCMGILLSISRYSKQK